MGFMMFTPYHISLEWSNRRGWSGPWVVWYAWGRREIFGWEPEEKSLLGSSSRRWKENIHMFLKDRGFNGADWINLVEAEKCGWILCTGQEICGLRQMHGIPWLAEELLASQEKMVSWSNLVQLNPYLTWSTNRTSSFFWKTLRCTK